jgi:hypothetical protein
MIKCLWCGKKFDWDETMFQFCNDCIDKLETIEKWAKTNGLVDFMETKLKGE